MVSTHHRVQTVSKRSNLDDQGVRLMQLQRLTCLLTLGLLAPVFSTSAFADEPKGDLAKVQGTWTAKIGPEKNIPITLTIKDDKTELKLTGPGGVEVKLTATIKIDEKASPKSYDLSNLTAPDGNELPDIKAIYKLDGDTWTTCSGGPGNDRPTKFEAGDEGPPNLTVWTRVKEEKTTSDLDKLQGIWTAGVGANDDVVVTLKIKEKTYTATYDRGDGTKVELKGEIKLDEKASPKNLDFVKTERNDGDDARDNLGIYTLEGESLKVCLGMPGNPRPSKFEKGTDGAPMLITFKKKKD